MVKNQSISIRINDNLYSFIDSITNERYTKSNLIEDLLKQAYRNKRKYVFGLVNEELEKIRQFCKAIGIEVICEINKDSIQIKLEEQKTLE